MGRFAIRERLGAGGMGEVYRADDTKLKRTVALKRLASHLRADELYRRRFLKEAERASQLEDQHIAGLYDVLEESGEMFLVMEYAEGQSLRARLGRPLAVGEFLKIAVQCAAALVAAHQRRIIHRDIKPENIVLSPSGQVKILDFGVAKQLPLTDERATQESLESTAGTPSGTPAYMPPEVLLGEEADERADIFSLGIVFYEALAGQHPFRAKSFTATCDRLLHHVPPALVDLNTQVPAEVGRIVNKMLAKDRAERYATAADLLVDLRAAQHASTHPAASAPRLAFLSRGKRWGVAVAIALMVSLALAAIPSLRRPLFRRIGLGSVGAPKTLVVLPFRAIGGGTENQVYSDGLTETLTAKLTQLTATHALQVVPSREVWTRQVANAEQARKELAASLVLEGTFDRSGSTVRINYAVVDAATLRQLRADTITVPTSDPFSIQDRVGEGVVRMLELELGPAERAAFTAHGTRIPGAYDLYLQGRGYLQNYDKPENITNAIHVFQQALGLDPQFAQAHAGLGEAYWKRYESVSKDPKWVEPARQACERALALNAGLPAAQVCLGTLDDGTGLYEKAAEAFQRALESEPTNDDAYRGLAQAYEHLGKLADAERTYHRAIELRPRYWVGYNWLGVFYYHQARYADAVQMFAQVVALAPDSFRGYSNMGATYVEQGRYAQAITVLERSVAIRPTAGAYSNLATAYFYQRRFADSARTYEEASKLDARHYLVWGNLGEADYWAPGKRSQAVTAFQKAISLAEEKLHVNPRDPQVLADRAWFQAMAGEPAPALASLQQALRLAPDSPGVRFKAAQVYNQLGRSVDALAWLEKALDAGASPHTVRDNPFFDSLRSNPRFQRLLQGK